MSLMENRLLLGKNLLSKISYHVTAIDENEQNNGLGMGQMADPN